VRTLAELLYLHIPQAYILALTVIVQLLQKAAVETEVDAHAVASLPVFSPEIGVNNEI